MKKRIECLSETELLSIVCDQLNSTDLAICEEHLQDCPACCESLEQCSADGGTWDAVRNFLPDDEHDAQQFTSGALSGRLDSPDSEKLLRFLAPTDDPHMLGRLGTYEVSGIVGQGGMGIVLKAFDRTQSRFIAVKVPAPGFWDDQQARERFAREARAAASIVHDNVVEIHGVAEFNGIPYFTMPYLRGASLQKRIDRQGPLSPEEILRIAKQIAAGLSAAHAQGLVHRDVKPANILLNDGAERVWITDFGIAQLGTDARITQTGLITGTPQYMSPEQVRGETVDSRSDLFSLGSVMYAMCTGRPPFESESGYELLNQVVAASPQRIEELNPSIPLWLAAVISNLHSSAPEERCQTAAELEEQLEQCLASVQQPGKVSRPLSVNQLESRYCRRDRNNTRKFIIGGFLMSAFVIALLLAGGLPLTSTTSTPQPAAVAPPADSISVSGTAVDEKGRPIPKTTILAVQKTWPNNRYQQRMLKTTTDAKGNFTFDNFSQPGSQYAFLLTVVSGQYLMTSEYRVVKNGVQQKPVTLKTAKAKPTTIRFQDAGGKPVSKVAVLPSKRTTADGKQHLCYAFHQVKKSGWQSGENGEVQFGSWKAGESASIVYMRNGQSEEYEFTVGKPQTITVTIK